MQNKLNIHLNPCFFSPIGHFPPSLPLLPLPPVTVLLAMENSSVASASSEAGSTRSQEIEELERFIDSYVLEYQVQGLLGDKTDVDLELDNSGKMPQVRALTFSSYLLTVASV